MGDNGGFKITQGATNYMIGLGWDTNTYANVVGSTPGVTGYAASYQYKYLCGGKFQLHRVDLLLCISGPVGVSDGWVVVAGSQGCIQIANQLPLYVFV